MSDLVDERIVGRVAMFGDPMIVRLVDHLLCTWRDVDGDRIVSGRPGDAQLASREFRRWLVRAESPSRRRVLRSNARSRHRASRVRRQSFRHHHRARRCPAGHERSLGGLVECEKLPEELLRDGHLPSLPERAAAVDGVIPSGSPMPLAAVVRTDTHEHRPELLDDDAIGARAAAQLRTPRGRRTGACTVNTTR